MSDIKFIVSKRLGDLSVNDSYEPVWLYTSNNPDFIAGMCAVSIPLLSSLSREGMIYDVVIQGADLSSYRVLNNCPSDMVEELDCFSVVDSNTEMCNILFSLIQDKMGVWVKGGDVRYISYSLYHFRDKEFFHGMNQCANYFNRDFRDFICRQPMTSSDVIQRIDNFTFQGPRLFEVDFISREVDEQEIDDENIQAPYQDVDYYEQEFHHSMSHY